MTVFERIKYLAQKQGKSLNQVEEELGLSKNVLYRMKNSDNPTKERLLVLANYFDVSVDYLLGRTDDPTGTVKDTGPGSDLVGYFRINTANMPPEDAEGIEEELKEYMAYLVSKVEGKNKKKSKD
ncbi:helix-turn-helix domain-containing protein [Enterococcus sp. ALS3]|uniref:Helix-turn-helix domain-containing protein n=1 Tax=Enterococcus alishanensis TaxID=1303817 RepID=A0ABS6TDW3_9ENTE|nr:helix-turn-helix transcriptional regulator [Enterococcus alishanensis]MBV7391090.1 helix-turn-helix domain-containing protein [Enterococcus alishanensis]